LEQEVGEAHARRLQVHKNILVRVSYTRHFKSQKHLWRNGYSKEDSQFSEGAGRTFVSKHTFYDLKLHLLFYKKKTIFDLIFGIILSCQCSFVFQNSSEVDI
jgi:hypothetical protein